MTNLVGFIVGLLVVLVMGLGVIIGKLDTIIGLLQLLVAK